MKILFLRELAIMCFILRRIVGGLSANHPSGFLFQAFGRLPNFWKIAFGEEDVPAFPDERVIYRPRARSAGEESPDDAGLSIFNQTFEKIKSSDHRVPHMGWNEIIWQGDHPVIEGVKNKKDFYFVHSYYLKGKNEHTLSCTHYEQEFSSSVAKDNVIAFQFHPEKSQKNGLTLIENFCWWDGKC